MTHLLDTNAWVDHLRRGAASKVTAKLVAAPRGAVALCSVVVAELNFGAIRSGPLHEAANRSLIVNLRSRYPSLPFDDDAAAEYGVVKAQLFAAGTPIGPNDLLIAAIARTHGLTLVTHNVAEFSRVPGLLVEDWQ